MTRDLAADLALSFFAYDMGFMYQLRDFFQTHDMGVMRLHNGQGCSHFLTHDMGKIEKNLGTSRKNICVERCFELFSRVGWGGFGKLQSEAWGGVVWAAHASCFGCPCFQRMGWEGFRKCQNKS
jgi:hypothetical protein